MKTFALFISSAFFLLFLQIDPIKSGEIEIKKVRYLIPKTFEWSEPIDLILSGGKVKSLSKFSKKRHKEEKGEPIRYAIPSFCDGYATIGADSLGYQNDYSGIKKSLLSFLNHGFTKIHLVGDGHWTRALKDEIDKGKLIGPEIIISDRPIVVNSPETENLSEQLYFVPKNEGALEKEVSSQIQKRSKILNLFYRYHDNSKFSFSVKILNQVLKETRSANKELLVSAYADRQSILESLSAGVTAISHPIGIEIGEEFSPLYLHELRWIPLFNVYYFQMNQGTEILKKDFNYMKMKSRFFAKNYSSIMEGALGKNTLSVEERENAKKEFAGYIDFFNSNPSLSKKMILGSGSGNLFSFPGISGLMELKIIHSITADLKGIVKIATENSCSFLSGERDGVIEEGRKANLLILKENPFLDFDNLFKIEAVFLNGKSVFLETENESRKVKLKKKNKSLNRGKDGKKEK